MIQVKYHINEQRKKQKMNMKNLELNKIENIFPQWMKCINNIWKVKIINENNNSMWKYEIYSRNDGNI